MANVQKVLAMTTDGRITYCTCPPELRGKGRCNHVLHQEEGESQTEFITRVSESENLDCYHMTEEEKDELMCIKGRKDLDDPECEGGYIELDTPVWSPSNVKEFSEMSGINSSVVSNVLTGKIYVTKDDLKLKKFKDVEQEKKDDPDFDKKYYTGVQALNDFAAAEGYEATKDVYVLPYYMRQNTGDIKNPINVLYNALIVSDNSNKNLKNSNKPLNSDKVQAAYERLLDNKHSEKKGVKPLTSHGGFKVDSLSDLVNGKSGIMRGYITGFSIPYSGRAVISPNAKIKLGECGIPANMCANIFEPTLRKNMQNKGYSEDSITDILNRCKSKKPTKEDVVIIDQLLREDGTKCLINRQPSLHKGSMICVKARATECVAHTGGKSSSSDRVEMRNKDTVQLHPMLCKGQNADFDGDTNAIYALNDKEIGDDAWHEMSPFTQFISHNPKNLGEAMTVPTKDALYGLLSILGDNKK